MLKCYGCGHPIPAGRYSHLCRTCDPSTVPAARCVRPLRCYCSEHHGTPARQVAAAAPRAYGYDIAPLLDGKVKA